VDAQDKNLKRFDKALGQVKRNMMVAAGAAVALGAGLAKVVYDVGMAGDAVAKTADKLGIGIEQLQELQFAAKRSGVDVRTLNMALQRMTRRMSEAASDTGEAKDAIKELGLDAKVLAKQGPDEILMAIAGAMETVTVDSDRLRLAFKLFDSEGVAVVNMLKNGEAGLQQLRDQARGLGYVLSEEAARDAEKFADGLTDMKAIAGGLKNTIGSALIPEVNRMMRDFQDWYLVNRDLISQRLDEWAEKVADGVERVGKTAGDIDRFVESLGGWQVAISALGTGVGFGALLKFLAPIIPLFSGLAGVIGISTGLFWGLVAAAIATVAALTAVVLISEDLKVLFEGGHSAIGEWIEDTKAAGGFWGQFAVNMEKTLKIIKALWSQKNKMIDFFKGIEIAGVDMGDALNGVFEFLGTGFRELLLWPMQQWEKLLDKIISNMERFGLVGAGDALYQPQAAGAGAGGNSTSVQVGDTQITVNPPPGADPEQVAQAVAREIAKAKAAQNRATRAAILTGSDL
jgi:hypothetical protein